MVKCMTTSEHLSTALGGLTSHGNNKMDIFPLKHLLL